MTPAERAAYIAAIVDRAPEPPADVREQLTRALRAGARQAAKAGGTK